MKRCPRSHSEHAIGTAKTRIRPAPLCQNAIAAAHARAPNNPTPAGSRLEQFPWKFGEGFLFAAAQNDIARLDRDFRCKLMGNFIEDAMNVERQLETGDAEVLRLEQLIVVIRLA